MEVASLGGLFRLALSLRPHLAPLFPEPVLTQDGGIAPNTSSKIDGLRSVEADRQIGATQSIFADVKSGGGTASIVIQFMDGLLADELSSATLARLVDLDLSLAIECFAGLQQ